MGVNRQFGIALLLLVACTRESEPPLRVSLDAPVTHFNWNRSEDPNAQIVIYQLMEGLFSHLDGPGSIQPRHCERWEEKDRKVIVGIRRGIRWSDGVELTIQDYMDAWRQLLDPSNANPYAQSFFRITGAKQWTLHQQGAFETVGIKKIDPYTVELSLDEPFPQLRELLSMPFTFPIRSDWIQLQGNGFGRILPLITVGPFQLDEWSYGEKVILKRNPTYFGPRAKLQTIVFHMGSDLSSFVTLFDLGKIDLIPQIPTHEVRLRGQSTNLVQAPSRKSFSLGFSLKGFTSDARIRRAIAHAIDEKELVQKTQENHKAQKSMIPAGFSESNPTIGLRFDPDRARQLLQTAGFTQERTPPPIRFVFPSNSRTLRIAENVRDQLRRNLGIQLQLTELDWNQYSSQLQTGLADVWPIDRKETLVSARDVLRLGLADLNDRKQNWTSPLFERLLNDADRSSSLAQRKALFDEAQKILLEEQALVVPLFQEQRTALVKTYIRDFRFSAYGDFSLRDVWIDQHQYKPNR